MQGRYAEAATLAKGAIRAGAGDLRLLHGIADAASVDEKSRQRLAAAAGGHSTPALIR
jgi:hypothetical protein